MPGMPLVTLTAGCLAYGHVPLLDHADFQLDAGLGQDLGDALARVAPVGPDLLESQVPGVRQLDDPHAAVAILHVRGMNQN